MRRPQAHTIQEQAEQLFEAKLPIEWVKRRQTPDYGIDYQIEIVEQNELMGLRFAVQLKGIGGKQPLSKRPRFSLDTSHLEYYLKERLPVYLFVIDVRRNVGHWVFIQEYVRNRLREKDWRTQKSVTIELPASQQLGKNKMLRQSLDDADKFMAALHPAAIPAAIRATQERYELLDPRFRIEIHASENSVGHTMHAREPVQIQLKIKGDPKIVSQKIEDVIGRGLPIKFQQGEIEFTGSPLFEEIFKAGGTLQVGSDLPCTIDLTSIDPNSKTIGTINHIPGTISGGSLEYHIHAQLPDSPINIEMSGPSFLDAPASTHSFSLSFKPRFWIGKPITRLPYFDSIRSLFNANIAVFKTSVFDHGNLMSFAKTSTPLPTIIDDIRVFLELLSQARGVAKHFKVEPNLPAHIGKKEAQEISDLFEFVRLVGSSESCLGTRFTTNLVPHNGIDELIETVSNKKDAIMELASEGKSMPFLGINIDTGPFKYVFSNPVLHSTEAELRQSFQESGQHDTKIEWVGGDSSTLEIKLL